MSPVPLYLFFLLSLLGSCSHFSKSDQHNLRKLYSEKKFEKALSFIEQSEMSKNSSNELLYYLNKGKITFSAKDYYSSSFYFECARKLQDEFFTVSISESVLTQIATTEDKVYKGQIFEKSLVYYYLSLSYYHIYRLGNYTLRPLKCGRKNGNAQDIQGPSANVVRKVSLNSKERKEFLLKARATILAWDTFQKEIKRSDSKTIIKFDFFPKIMAGLIHESTGIRGDDRIAHLLYKDALRLLKGPAKAYMSFNENYEQFHKLFWDNDSTSAINKKVKEKGQQYFKETQDYKSLVTFLESKIKKTSLANSQASSDQLKNIKKKLLIETSAIAPKKSETLSYNLKSALNSMDDGPSKTLVQAIGIPVLTYFAMGPLGLGVSSTARNNSTRVLMGHNLGTLATSEAGVEFEVASIEKGDNQIDASSKLYIFKKSNGPTISKELLYKDIYAESPLFLISSVSDLAYTENKEQIARSYISRGSRIALKHLLAIVAAYKTYESLKKNNNELIARPIAFAQYLASAKLIKQTEKADTRYWVTLAHRIYTSEIDLPKGDYILGIRPKESRKIEKLGELSIDDEREEIISYQY